MRFWISFLFLSLGVALAQIPTPPRAQPIDGFAAEVDGVVITVGDVVNRIRPRLMSMRERVQGPELMEEQARPKTAHRWYASAKAFWKSSRWTRLMLVQAPLQEWKEEERLTKLNSKKVLK